MNRIERERLGAPLPARPAGPRIGEIWQSPTGHHWRVTNIDVDGVWLSYVKLADGFVGRAFAPGARGLMTMYECFEKGWIKVET